MSDGGAGSVKRSNGGGGGGDEYGRAVARLAMAQICEAVGFQGFEQSALDALSDVAVRYLKEMGQAARFYANAAGRTECNAFDVVQGLEEFSPLGFAGASDVNHCLLASGAVKEIEQYVNTTEEMPFVGCIPRFPIAKKKKRMIPSFSQIGESPPGAHIPDWLPAFPDPHTYISTPVWNERSTDAKADRIEQVKQRRKAETSLLNLQQKLANGVVEHGPAVVAADETRRETIEAEGNPFLAPPLQSGEKDVSLVTVPVPLLKEEQEKSVSLVEAFAPAIEGLKGVSAGNGEISERTALPRSRLIVKFKCAVDKKLLTVPKEFSGRHSSSDRLDQWFGKNEENDDRKRRAEQIMKQAMENPRDLAQL